MPLHAATSAAITTAMMTPLSAIDIASARLTKTPVPIIEPSPRRIAPGRLRRRGSMGKGVGIREWGLGTGDWEIVTSYSSLRTAETLKKRENTERRSGNGEW